METMIEVRGLDVVLDHKTIVHNINLDIPKAKITAIIGPNGCGKSTTLKAICRINPVSAGCISLLGKEVGAYSYREFAQKLAILTQSPVAPSDITVRDLLRWGGSLTASSLAGLLRKTGIASNGLCRRPI